MKEVIYTLPVPSTAFLKDPQFQTGLGRECALVCEYEDEEMQADANITLIFDKIEALKVTYHKAVDFEIIHSAYDKVINCGTTKWLAEIKNNLVVNEVGADNLHHFAVYFDDGPLYEFVCEDFRIEKQ